MTEGIIISVVSGALTLVGVCVTAWASAKNTRNAVTAKLETAQAVTDTKIDELTREVRLHNGFAQRIPVLEEQMKVANKRIGDLEKISKGDKA